MIGRHLSKLLLHKLEDRKVIVLPGPRQCGKSTWLHEPESKFAAPVAFWNGDESDIRDRFENATSTRLKSMVGINKTLVIDEAQRIPGIGTG